MNLYEVNGFYGTRNRGTILVYETNSGKRWYCVEGSCNINCTYDDINEGCDVERISDFDTMSSRDGTHRILIRVSLINILIVRRLEFK
jgi:hypothetical protein